MDYDYCECQPRYCDRDIADENYIRNYYGSTEHWKFKYEWVKSQLDECKRQIDWYKEWQEHEAETWKQGFSTQVKNGLNVSLHPEQMYGTEVIDQYSVSPEISGDVENDVVVNVKADDEEPGLFKMRLMSSKVSTVVTKDGEELPTVVQVPVEVPVEVIKEVSVEVSVDMTDEIQREQLQTLKSINNQLSSIQDDVKDAKCKDMLSSILQQLSSMTYLSSMSEIKGQLSSVIANNHSVRVING